MLTRGTSLVRLFDRDKFVMRSLQGVNTPVDGGSGILPTAKARYDCQPDLTERCGQKLKIGVTYLPVQIGTITCGALPGYKW